MDDEGDESTQENVDHANSASYHEHYISGNELRKLAYCGMKA